MLNENDSSKLLSDRYAMEINTGNSAKNALLQFTVTINIAYFIALYTLREQIELTQNVSDSNQKWTILSSIFIFLINFCFSVLYRRHHINIGLCLDKLNNLQVNNSGKNYKTNNYRDHYQGIANFVISL